jgi:hypothetical protein
MHTTHDDNATTWRDLADQLTPKQIVDLEVCDRKQIPPGIIDSRQGALNYARAMARDNIVQAMYADIAPPPDATDEPREREKWEYGYGRTYSCIPSSTAVKIRLRFGAATSAALGCGGSGDRGGPVIVAVIPSSLVDVA